MTPFISHHSRLLDNFETFRALNRGLYYIDTEEVIERMMERMSEEAPPIASQVAEDSPLWYIRRMMLEDQTELVHLAEEVERSATEAENFRVILDYSATRTIWRLRLGLILMGVFALASIICFVLGQTVAGAVSLVAFVVLTVSFLDELDVRSAELGEQYERLRLACSYAAANTIDFKMQHSNHAFIYEIMKKRFGEDFTQPQAKDTSAFDETYNPDAESSSDMHFV